MLKLTFYTPKERRPKDGEQVLCLRHSRFYGSWEFDNAEVEWVWDFLDEDGRPCFDGAFWQEGDIQPENSRLVFYLSGAGPFQFDDEEILLHYPDEIENDLITLANFKSTK